MKQLTSLLFTVIFCAMALAQDAELLLFLNNQDDVEVLPCLTPDGYIIAYTIFIEQPIDHQNPDEGTFKQKVFLSHMHKDSSVVLVTEGYNRGVQLEPRCPALW